MKPRHWTLPSPSTSGSLGMAGEAEWRNVLLGDLAASTRNALVGGPFGSDLVSSDYSSTGVPVIRGENVSSGRWIRLVISQSQMKLTVDPRKVDPLFIYYLFRALTQQEYLQRNEIQTGG